MYERMLDKSVRPDLYQLIEWCGTKGTLFSDLIQFMTGTKCAQSEIRFPEHCEKRGADFLDAKNVKNAIENTWQKQREKNDKICYYLEVSQ